MTPEAIVLAVGFGIFTAWNIALTFALIGEHERVSFIAHNAARALRALQILVTRKANR